MESRKDEWSPRADYWNTEDHQTTLSSRVSLMEKLGQNLSGTAIRTFQSLCPGDPVPNRIEAITAQLNESPSRLTQWWRSSARSGADTAL
jgi:hypothetical protein